jgi:hypothetical protein
MCDPHLPIYAIANTIWSEDLRSATLDPSGEFRGTPYGFWYEVANASLTLRGIQRTIAALDAMALVMRKKESLLKEISVKIEFKPTLGSHVVGIASMRYTSCA